MSRISASAGYEGHLWLDHELGERSYPLSWDENKLTVGVSGINIETEFDLLDEEKMQIVSALAVEDPSLPPLWQDVPPKLQRIVDRMASKLLAAATIADRSLRAIPKGIRLPPLKFHQHRINGGQEFPVFYWSFSQAEKDQLLPVISKLGSKALIAYDRGIQLPMTKHFERRQVHLTKEDVDNIQRHLHSGSEPEAFRTLYALALDSFTSRSYDSAVLILATSIETALKSYLARHGDGISNYLLDNIQSPPIDKLYSCARKQGQLNLPKDYGESLAKLRDARNSIAHKPKLQSFEPMQIARWFAIGEAILSSMAGDSPDFLIGKLVEPIGDKAPETFPPSAKGIILRREVLYNENSYHIVIDTGETWRFGDKSFKVCENQAFGS